MFRIFKYPFDIVDEFSVEMPEGASIVHVECQKNIPCIWAKVDPDKPMVKRYFRLYGTGHPIKNGDYIATFQQPPFVWHLFHEPKYPIHAQ